MVDEPSVVNSFNGVFDNVGQGKGLFVLFIMD